MPTTSRTVKEIHNTPTNAANTIPISSNWAYDHITSQHTNINRIGVGIGVAGTQGFGVGIAEVIPENFSIMTGTNDIASDNYGNYQYSDGSVMVYIPKFYYRIGSNVSPRYATYGNNAIDIVGVETYDNQATANTSGYALHRAFIDGGIEQPGFFYDKYECSNNSGTPSSLKNGNPISTTTAHNPINGLTGAPANIYGSCVTAAKIRGSTFHCSSQFQTSALALLATAHGQAASSATYCAWYNAGLTTNFPKGCNNNALADTNDTAVKWESDGYPNCGKTGSAGYGGGEGNVFAKSTHNGQNCGVADLNGNMFEVNLGMTCIATTKTISGATKANPCQITTSTNHGYSNSNIIMITSVVGMTQLNDKMYTITVTGDTTFTLHGVDSSGYTDYDSAGTVTTGSFYVAKQSVAMKNFTAGNTLATDHWGATGVASMMEPITPNFNTISGQNGLAQRYGNSTNQVLEEETSGNNWLLTGLGLPKSGGMSTGGTNLFGVDYYYQYIRNELCVVSGGGWGNTTDAGVWYLYVGDDRAGSYHSVGFRCAAYV